MCRLNELSKNAAQLRAASANQRLPAFHERKATTKLLCKKESGILLTQSVSQPRRSLKK